MTLNTSDKILRYGSQHGYVGSDIYSGLTKFDGRTLGATVRHDNFVLVAQCEGKQNALTWINQLSKLGYKSAEGSNNKREGRRCWVYRKNNSPDVMLINENTPQYTLAIYFSPNKSSSKLSDLKAFRLKGYVRRVTYDNGIVLEFNKEGNLIYAKNTEGHASQKISRNAKGLVSVIDFGSYGGEWKLEYTNNTLTHIVMNYIYWYDEYYYSNFTDGIPWTVKFRGAGEGISSEITGSCLYAEPDSHDNYCYRKLRGVTYTRDCRDETSVEKSYNDIETNRKIEYY